MSRSKRKKGLLDTIAAWLYDAFGADGEKQSNYNWDAADFLRFMKANGFEFHVIDPEVERPPF